MQREGDIFALEYKDPEKHRLSGGNHHSSKDRQGKVVTSSKAGRFLLVNPVRQQEFILNPVSSPGLVWGASSADLGDRLPPARKAEAGGCGLQKIKGICRPADSETSSIFIT